MDRCRSDEEGAVRTSGRVTWLFFSFCCSVKPIKWKSKPELPGSMKRLSWGPKGPTESSGHTVLMAERERERRGGFVFSKSLHHHYHQRWYNKHDQKHTCLLCRHCNMWLIWSSCRKSSDWRNSTNQDLNTWQVWDQTPPAAQHLHTHTRPRFIKYGERPYMWPC